MHSSSSTNNRGGGGMMMRRPAGGLLGSSHNTNRSNIGSSSIGGGAHGSGGGGSAGGTNGGGYGRMAKYVNPTMDGMYTDAYHKTYAHCPWVKISRLNRALTEGDILTVLSQFGEVLDVRLATRDHDGAPTGFAYAEYANPTSAAIACDALNSSPIGNIAAASAAAISNENTRQQQQGGVNGSSSAAAPSGGAAVLSGGTATHRSMIGVGVGVTTAGALDGRHGGGGGGSAAALTAAPNAFICRLLPTDAVGIEVDHCDAKEVPPLRAGLEGYGHWFHRVFVGGQ